MKKQDIKIYISGAISSNLGSYKEEFAKAEETLRGYGYEKIMNPSVLPEGFDYYDYIDITAVMLSVCDVMVMLPGWQTSVGAHTERVLANASGIKILETLEEAEGYINGYSE